MLHNKANEILDEKKILQREKTQTGRRGINRSDAKIVNKQK